MKKMKTIVFYTEKGGAAKTASSCQFAHALAKKELSVMFIDLDSQEGRASTLMKQLKSGVSAYKVLKGEVSDVDPVEGGGITMIEGERALRTLEAEAPNHNAFVANFRKFINNCENKFDYCIIDCPPSADVRVKAALISADFVVSPVKLAQEHVLGIGPVLGLIELIRQKMNPKLVFLGLLVTQFEAKNIQKQWFQVLAGRYAKLLIGTKIPNRAHIQEAQQLGIWVGDIPKSAAKETSRELTQVFDVLIEKMENHNG
jgi:chromosome partitioning protein